MAQILIVGGTVARTEVLGKLFKEAGYGISVRHDFREAVGALIEHSPDLLISEVRLGAFNGLQLAIRCQILHPGVRTIVLDRAHDAALEFEAQRYGALYLVEPLDEASLVVKVSTMLAETGPHRRWPRKQLTSEGILLAEVARNPARIVDLSYGGFRLELSEPANESGFDVAFSGFGLALRAKPVWTRRGPSGSFWCGAELSEGNPQTVSVWRQIVDSVQAA
jgi:DNA-binding response OmpR family regulator